MNKTAILTIAFSLMLSVTAFAGQDVMMKRQEPVMKAMPMTTKNVAKKKKRVHSYAKRAVRKARRSK